MGDIISGVFGGGSREQQVVTPDAASQYFNQIRADELGQLFSQFDYSDFANLSPTSALDDRTLGLLNSMASSENLFNLQDYINLGLDEGSNYISQVATPSIEAALAAQGMEGSGALPAEIARATAGIALPFLQGLPGAAVAGNQANTNLLSLSDMPRQLQNQELLRRQGVVTTGLTGIPFNPGATTVGETRQPSIFENIFGIGSATGSFFGGSGFGAGGFAAKGLSGTGAGI